MQDIFTLNWLVGDVISQIYFYDEGNRWSIVFKSGCILIVDCLWRLRVDNCIVLTSLDHGQTFGLAAPFDAIATLHQQIGLTPISAITVKHIVADLEIHFGSDIVFEVIRNSAAYEAWQAITADGLRVTAMGNGELSA